MAHAIDPSGELDALATTLDAFATLRERIEERLDEAASDVSAWCGAQHLFHVALATDLALRNVLSLAHGRRGAGGQVVH